MKTKLRMSLPHVLAGLAAMLLAACSVGPRPAAEAQAQPGDDARAAGVATGARRVAAPAPATVKAISHPILFVTQVPTAGDPFASRLSAFANHEPGIGAAPRGGDLMIRYPDGTLRNLTREAGYGMDGRQGANAIAVREPTVHWSGTRAIFSMVIGAPLQQYDQTDGKWQMYEVTGLERGGTARITRVAHQPSNYNNISPLYTSDDDILFTSDRARRGEAHLYPSLDEYESTPTVTGIFRLDRGPSTVRLLNHTPSGAFTPVIDSHGRVIFTRWDHLQQDQQQDGAIYLGYTYEPFNYASEAPGAASIGLVPDTFPEARRETTSPAYGRVAGHTYNLFTPWQMNQDGSEELTLDHIGRHELVGDYTYLPRAFLDDASLRDNVNLSFFSNRKHVRMDGGVFHIRENPVAPGTYYGIYAREFGEGVTNQIVRFTGAPTLNAEQMVISNASPPPTDTGLPGGRFRNPLPLVSGDMVASYTPDAYFGRSSGLRLHRLDVDSAGMFVPGNPLTPGISKSVSWWGASGLVEYSGPLWEIEPVEVVARTPPPLTAQPALEPPEAAILAAEGISEPSLRRWLHENDLALIVTRNQTSRDRADRQQPFNLNVPGGVRKTGDGGRVYDIAHYQIVQANMVRGYAAFRQGRRPVAQPMAVAANPANPSGPAGSVKIAADGSTAAFVPASRALSWQTVDPAGEPVVRERVWVSLQPGEIRTCAGCHGENTRNQAGQSAPTNPPQALRELMRHWKQAYGGTVGRRRNGSAPLQPSG